jgi:hypothetical protein
MKSTLSLVLVAICMLVVAACGSKGIDEATKTQLTEFETNWQSMMASAETVRATAETEVQNWQRNHEAMKATMTDESKTAMAEHMAVCDACVNDGAALAESAKYDIEAWQAAGEEWAAWKQKVLDGEVNQEDATTGLTDWNNKLTEANTAIANWNGTWGTITALHTETENAMSEMMASNEVAPE